MTRFRLKKKRRGAVCLKNARKKSTGPKSDAFLFML